MKDSYKFKTQFLKLNDFGYSKQDKELFYEISELGNNPPWTFARYKTMTKLTDAEYSISKSALISLPAMCLDTLKLSLLLALLNLAQE